MLITVFVLLVLVGAAAWAGWSGRVVVPADHVGIVTRRFGPAHAESAFKEVNPDNARGVHARTLLPGGFHWLTPVLHSVEYVPRVRVPAGMVGLVSAKEGHTRTDGRTLGRHVECDNFQNGEAFLRGGGEQGRQLAILGGGAYYDINPELFDVITVDNVAASRDGLTEAHLQEVSIEEGCTGVVITLDGAEPGQDATGVVAPRVEGHGSFRRPWVFLDNNGQRGIQEETLGQGTTYALNPWFVRVLLIPTRVIYLTWHNKQESEAENFDADLGQITVNVQGFDLDVNLTQNLQIPRAVAPRLVSQFGGVRTSGLGGLVDDPAPLRRFVRNVLGNTVAGYFGEIAVTASVLEFLGRYQDIRKELTDQVRHALEQWGVGVLGTSLGRFIPRDPSLLERLKEKFAEQARLATLEVGVEQAKLRDLIDTFDALAEARRVGLELQKEVELLGRENVTLIRVVGEFSKFDVPKYIGGGGDISDYVQMLPLTVKQELLTRLRGLHMTHRIDPDDELRELTEDTDDD